MAKVVPITERCTDDAFIPGISRDTRDIAAKWTAVAPCVAIASRGSTTLAGLIGPNAIIRTVEALRARLGDSEAVEILNACALDSYAREMPRTMVPESQVTALYQTLRERLDREEARAIARDAGRRTAKYVLTNRIPNIAQGLLPALPRPLGRRGLMLAIKANAWTFAGSARIRMRFSAPASISLTGCPICRNARVRQPTCEYYSATFEHLFRTLVDPAFRVEEVACQAEGAPACVFQIFAA